MTLTLRVLYEPDVNHLKDIHVHYGTEYAEVILPNIAKEVLKAVVVRFFACFR